VSTLHTHTAAALPPLQAATPRRFMVTVTRADGKTRTYTVTGGASCDHVRDAMTEAGLGGTVRVLPLDLKVAA